jgi:hypothetical protein
MCLECVLVDSIKMDGFKLGHDDCGRRYPAAT